MKRFLQHVAVFSLVLLVAGRLLEVMLRQVPNPYTFKRNLIEQHADSVKNLVIGSSVSNYGLNPACFADSTLNLSINGQWIRFNQAVLERYIHQMPHLKNVIWGFCYHTLWSDDCEETDKGDVVYHRIYWNIGFDNHWSEQSELLATGSIALKKWSKYYLLRQETMQCDSLGLDRGYPLSDRSPKWKEVSVRHAKGHTTYAGEASERLYDENVRRMHEVARLCRAKGIRLHLVFFPASRDYYQHTSEQQVALINESFAELADCYEHVYVYDYFRDARVCRLGNA